MRNPFTFFWRHPRRTGFIVFNVIVVVLLFAWGTFTNSMSRDGIAALPNLMLGYTGMGLLLVAWVAGWIAWGVMVSSRHAHHLPPVEQPVPPRGAE